MVLKGVDNMYKIGDFSKIVGIPVRTLRFYAQYGVLEPSQIDNFTGYRYYSDENVIECELIKLLKSLDFTLEEIATYKNHLNNEILEKKKKEIEERIYLLSLKYKRLEILQQQSALKKINELQETTEEKVLRRKYEKRNIKRNA
ncbi:MAG: MerR family transcriptional regulator [Acholeplasma sp.]|nr:MerR family transcriptional regulator [Acholeplasma sp.]